MKPRQELEQEIKLYRKLAIKFLEDWAKHDKKVDYMLFKDFRAKAQSLELELETFNQRLKSVSND